MVAQDVSGELLEIQFHAEMAESAVQRGECGADTLNRLWAIIYLAQFARTGAKPHDYHEVTSEKDTETQ